MTEVYEIKKYYASDYLTADGDALTQHTVAATSTDTILKAVGLTQADDYWNGSLLFFDTDTTTTALQGVYMAIKDSDQSDTTVTLAYALPSTPAITDTFRIVKGGKWRSTYRLPGKTIDSGVVNVTGVAIDYVSEENADGIGNIAYTHSGQTLEWYDLDDTTAGAAVAVGAGGTFYLESLSSGKWIEVTVTAGSLPGTDQNDTIVLSTKTQTRLSDITGANTTSGVTSYYAEVYKNESSSIAQSLAFYIEPYDANTTTMVDALGVVAATAEVTDGSTMPATSFWIYNVTKNDVRWVDYRSGNDLVLFTAGTGVLRRGLVAVSWDIGDTIKVYSNVDIAYEEPTGTEFTDDLTSLTYSSPLAIVDALRFLPLAVSGITMLAYREVVPALARARSSIKDTISYCWE